MRSSFVSPRQWKHARWGPKIEITCCCWRGPPGLLPPSRRVSGLSVSGQPESQLSNMVHDFFVDVKVFYVVILGFGGERWHTEHLQSQRCPSLNGFVSPGGTQY